MGVDDSEFVSPFPGTGRIHIYTGTGGVLAPGIWPATPEVQLWSQLHVLKQYDMVVVGCSGTADETFPDEHSGKVAEYLDSGGRLFISHQGYPWLNRPSTMIAPMVEWDPNRADPPDGFATVDTNAAGGPQLASWLVAAGAVASPGTRVPLNRMSNEVARIDAPARTVLRANLGGGATADVDFVFEFPAGAGMPCGRVRFVQFHAYYFGNTATRFPTECPTGASTPAQKVVQHMLYDLGRCI
ncbi:hypothetical protein DFJ74DRAFT_686735 [Hyaloraphidium curvatum]|nr:hypothetical protein DFJ74DRAFT_686735 [Hyaloraphidium curvatum]